MSEERSIKDAVAKLKDNYNLEWKEYKYEFKTGGVPVYISSTNENIKPETINKLIAMVSNIKHVQDLLYKQIINNYNNKKYPYYPSKWDDEEYRKRTIDDIKYIIKLELLNIFIFEKDNVELLINEVCFDCGPLWGDHQIVINNAFDNRSGKINNSELNFSLQG